MRVIKTIAQPLARMPGVQPGDHSREREVLGDTNLVGGLVSEVDTEDLAPNQFANVLNCRYVNDKLSRRSALGLFGVTKPDALSVNAVQEYIANDGTRYLIRHTNTGIHVATSTSWVALLGTLTGVEKHRTAIIGDRYFFTNFADPIQELDFGAGSFGNLGNAPVAKFIIGLGDRLVAAHTDSDPTLVSWSGNLNYPEWSPLVDSSAGSEPLSASGSGLSDFITGGLFRLNEYGILVRDRSIWVISRNPSATNPFSFREAMTGVGSIMPDAIAQVGDSLIIPDYRAENIYVYNFPNKLTPLADPVRRRIFSSISDPEACFGVFNPTTAEYTLFIADGSTTYAWCYNFRTQSWAYSEYAALTAANAVDTSTFSLTIDELTGTVDELPGVVDDLGITTRQPPRLFIGHSTGEISNPTTGVSDWNGSFDVEVESKRYTRADQDIRIQDLEFVIKPLSTGSVTLEYSYDGGYSFNTIRSFTYDNSHIGRFQRMRRERSVQAGEFVWRITSTDLEFEILRYKLISSTGGKR